MANDSMSDYSLIVYVWSVQYPCSLLFLRSNNSAHDLLMVNCPLGQKLIFTKSKCRLYQYASKFELLSKALFKTRQVACVT